MALMKRNAAPQTDGGDGEEQGFGFEIPNLAGGGRPDPKPIIQTGKNLPEEMTRANFDAETGTAVGWAAFKAMNPWRSPEHRKSYLGAGNIITARTRGDEGFAVKLFADAIKFTPMIKKGGNRNNGGEWW